MRDIDVILLEDAYDSINKDKNYFDLEAQFKSGDVLAKEKAQELINNRAKEKNFTVHGFHGTSGDNFYTFNDEKGGEKTGWNSAGSGFFFTNDQQAAKKFSENLGQSNALATSFGGDPNQDLYFKSSEGQEYKKADEDLKALYQKIKQEATEIAKRKTDRFITGLEENGDERYIKSSDSIKEKYKNRIFMDYQDSKAKELRDSKYAEEIKKLISNSSEARKKFNNFVRSHKINSIPNKRIISAFLKMENPMINENDMDFFDVIKFAKQNNHDSVIFKNIKDGHTNVDYYTLFESNQIKLSNPFTYDDNNQLISFSKRFDSTNGDIRY
jgi:hypothetical protein